MPSAIDDGTARPAPVERRQRLIGYWTLDTNPVSRSPIASILLLAICACAGQPGSDMGANTVVIEGATALAGANLNPVEHAVVVIEDDKIAAIGPAGSIDIPEDAEIVDAAGLTLIPGFIDAHVHIAFADPRVVCANGVTTARDLAWIPTEIWPLVEKSKSPDFKGPRLLAAGQMLTVRNGYPTRASWAPPGVGLVVDSPANAAEAVRSQVESGASVIKVALNADTGPTLPETTLDAIVSAAHGHDLRVTAHITGLEELKKALGAGVDELAHILMSEERISDGVIKQMVAADVTVVPTLAVRFGRDQEVAIDNMKRFLEAGGRVVYGTDLGNAGPQPGIDAREVSALQAAGMSGREIIASATVESARYLGLTNTGVLAPGKTADIVAIKGNPLTSPDVLTNVAMVWRSGRRC
jgi:imidazolonepropionase-like amidohydrolase